MRSNTSKQGFTLIELLVVVSIISLLSIVILGALNDARAKARDRALFSEVLELQKAVELYKLKYGVYPAGGTYPDYISRSYLGTYSGAPNYATILTNLQEFIPNLPQPTTGSVGFYTQSNFRCVGQANAPYAIIFSPENVATFSHLPLYLNSSNGNSPTTHRCITNQ